MLGDGTLVRDCKVCTALTTLMDISVEAYEYASHGGRCECPETAAKACLDVCPLCGSEVGVSLDIWRTLSDADKEHHLALRKK